METFFIYWTFRDFHLTTWGRRTEDVYWTLGHGSEHKKRPFGIIPRIFLLTGHRSHKTLWQRTAGKHRHKTHKVMGNRWEQLEPGRKSPTHHNQTGNRWPNRFSMALQVTLCLAGTLSVNDPLKWTIPETLHREKVRFGSSPWGGGGGLKSVSLTCHCFLEGASNVARFNASFFGGKTHKGHIKTADGIIPGGMLQWSFPVWRSSVQVLRHETTLPPCCWHVVI